MKLQYGLSAFERARGNLPRLPVVNMFAEQAASEDDGVVLQSRPGLADVAAMGGEIQAMFAKDGVFSGDRFAVVDGDLYRGAALVDVLDGSGPFFLDGFEDKLFVAGGGSLWGYDGATLSAVTFPDGANVRKVLVGASRAICLRADTEKFYWSDVLSDTIDALSFASAESQPDGLKDALFIDDMLILFGAETVEFWPNTSDADLPFQPLEGRVFEAGIKATGSACALGTGFAWVTDDNRVCRNDPENVLSNEGLEEKIAASSACRLWTFWIDATEMLALSLDTQTWVMSARTGTWHEFRSYGESNWLPACYATGVFGTRDGRLVEWTGAHADFGGVMERLFRAGAALNSAAVIVNNIALRTNPGETPFLSGDYVEPSVELRTSRDGGRTWGAWRRASLGAQGEYRRKVQWVGCGGFGQPGMMAEFRVTDPVPFRVSGVFANEPFGGI